MPKINDTRFGEFEYTDDDVVTFPEGLVGFAECRRYVIVSRDPESPFRWLQSLDEPALAFLVADPSRFFENYQPFANGDLSAMMGIEGDAPVLLYATVSIPAGKPNEMTVNLAGPIVIDPAARLGRQFVLDDEAYTIKHRILEPEVPKGKEIAA